MQPDIYFLGLRIAEPVVALTGLGLAFLAGIAWRRLYRRKPHAPAQAWMLYFFGAMALSSVIGPLFGHAFQYRVGFPGKYASWFFSQLSLAALAQAAVMHARPLLRPSFFKLLSGLNLGFLLVALLAAAWKKQFWVVETHSAVALLGLLAPLEAWLFVRKRDPGSRYLLWALPAAAAAVLPHIFKWSPSVWFTYFDVGHVLLYPCLWLLLLGAERLQNHAPAV